MDQVMQSAPDAGATTPDMGAGQADVGQPAQQEGMAQPEGFQAEGGDQQQPELTPQEEFFLQAGTGTVYKTKEAAIAGIEEKDRLIKQFLESQRSQPAPAPQPAVDPQVAVNQAIQQLQAEFEADYRNDPKYREFSPEAIAEQAYIDAKNAYRIEQRVAKQYEQQQKQVEMQQFVRSTPELNTPLAQEVYDRAMAQGYKFPNPQAHLDAVHAEMFRRGMPPMQGQPQAGNMAVQGALQNQQRPIFGQPQGTGQQPQPALPPHVASSLAEAQKRGITDPAELDRIKNFAMNVNPSRFNKGGFSR